MNQAEVRRKQIEAVCRVIGVAVLLILGKKVAGGRDSLSGSLPWKSLTALWPCAQKLYRMSLAECCEAEKADPSTGMQTVSDTVYCFFR